MRHSQHRRPRGGGFADGYERANWPAARESGRSRSASRRALRLVVALGTGVFALGTVLAMVVAVVALGNSELTNPLSAAGRGLPAGISRANGHRGGSGVLLVAGKTLAHYSGHGAGRPAPLPIKVPGGTWGIYWSYRCPAGQQGTFALEEAGSHGSGKPNVDTSGRRGQGVWWDTSKPGHLDLLVVSDCPWQARVVLPLRTRDTGDHTGSHGRRHHHAGTHTPRPRHTPTPAPRPTHAPHPSPSPTARRQHAAGRSSP